MDLTPHYLARPTICSAFGTPNEVLRLPAAHQDQMHFLDPRGEQWLYDLIAGAQMLGGPYNDDTGQSHWPFRRGYFQTRQQSPHLDKKWLYRLGTPFRREVFLLPAYGPRHAAVTTWKMVIKYLDEISCADDHYVFDPSFNWCLLIYHEDTLHFGKDRIADRSA
ncbi:MAG: hypothetical protein OHK0039_35140 [Bacteroidia bacterium]